MRERGFTLIEVLVALAVFALSAAAILRQTQQAVSQQLLLEEKSYAMWLADDRLAALTSAAEWPPLGRATQSVTLQEREWKITTDVQATAMPELRRITVSVGRDDRDDYQLVSFTTFRGRF